MVNLLLGVLEQALKLWNSHESQKYLDKLISLKKDWHEEYNRPIEERSDLKLDSIELELRILSESFIEALGAKNSTDK
jgi:hypothetical protein